MLRIHVYTILKDEEEMLPYFLRHYTEFASKIFAFDDRSTDRTLDILRAEPKAVVETTAVEGIDDAYFRGVYGSEYQKRRDECDWVMCVDSDEFVYHPQLMQRLELYLEEGVKVVKCGGWSMFSEEFPSHDGQIYEAVRTGLYDVWQGKPAIFTPDIDITFRLGRHGVKKISPQTARINTDEDIKLLHYRFLGDEYCRLRNARNTKNLSEKNRRHKLGRHNFEDSRYYHSFRWYRYSMNHAVELPFLLQSEKLCES